MSTKPFLLLSCTRGHYFPWPTDLLPLPDCQVDVDGVYCGCEMKPLPGKFTVETPR